MTTQGHVIEGTVAFSHITEHEMIRDRDTGKETSTNKYSITLSLDDVAAKDLSEKGVKLKEWEGVKQRKFATGFEDFPVYDATQGEDDARWDGGEIGRGAKVRILFSLKPNTLHGMIPYMNRIKVLEHAPEMEMSDF
jgi:hypothetical protein